MILARHSPRRFTELAALTGAYYTELTNKGSSDLAVPATAGRT